MKKNNLSLFLFKLAVITFCYLILRKVHMTIIIIAFLYMFIQLPKNSKEKEYITTILEPFLLIALGFIIFNSITTLKEVREKNNGNKISAELNKIIDKSEEQILVEENCYNNPNIKLNKNSKPGMIFIDYDEQEISFLQCGYEIENFKLSNDGSCYSGIPKFRSNLSSPGKQIIMYSDSLWINKVEIKMIGKSTLYCCNPNIISVLGTNFVKNTDMNNETDGIEHNLSSKEAFELLSEHFEKYEKENRIRVVSINMIKMIKNKYRVQCVFDAPNGSNYYIIEYLDNRWVISQEGGYGNLTGDNVERYIDISNSTFLYLLEKRLKQDNPNSSFSVKDVSLIKQNDDNYYLVEYTKHYSDREIVSYIIFQFRDNEWIYDITKNIDINDKELYKYNFKNIN